MNASPRLRLLLLLLFSLAILSEAPSALAGPLGNTIRVPQDEPDLQTAINQVQGLTAATVIVDGSTSHAGPILITDSVSLVAAAGASPRITDGGFQAALRIEVPSVLFRPEVRVAISGIDLFAESNGTGPGAPLLDIVHGTDQTALRVELTDLDVAADFGFSRPCIGVRGQPTALRVDLFADGVDCLALADDGANVTAVGFDAPRGAMLLTGGSTVDVVSRDLGSTVGAVSFTNGGSGETVQLVIEDTVLSTRGVATDYFGVLASRLGTAVDVVDSRIVFEATNGTVPPARGGGAELLASPVRVFSGASMDVVSCRILNRSSLANDMYLFAGESQGAGAPTEFRLRNSLIDGGRIELQVGNAGGVPTAVDALLVNNTVYSPGRSALSLRTQAPSVGNLTLNAHSNLCIAASGLELNGLASGLQGQWDYNGYDVESSAAIGLSTGSHAVVADAFIASAEAGEFGLRRQSPLVDAGDTAAGQLHLPIRDLAGHPRFDGEIDIGAFELRQGPIFGDRFE